MNSNLLNLDAVNRAVRTFIQALTLEVLLVVGPLLQNALSDGNYVFTWNGWESLLRVAGLAALSYVMRRFLDPSRLPTPLPPEHPGEPAE